MATFPDIDADYGASKKAKPQVRSIQFGSGYSQRAQFGINQDPKVWTLQWITERRLMQIPSKTLRPVKVSSRLPGHLLTHL